MAFRRFLVMDEEDRINFNQVKTALRRIGEWPGVSQRQTGMGNGL